MNYRLRVLFVVVIFSFSAQYSFALDVEPSLPAIQEVVTQNLQERTKLSGTLDLMDPQTNKIRNLKMVNFEDKIEHKDSMLVAFIDQRDIKTGDLVSTAVNLEGKDGKLMVKDYTIVKVMPAAVKTVDPNKTFSDGEILEFMMEYLKSQAQQTGSVSLFDEQKNQLRDLELVKMDEKLRRLGIIYITSAEFKDKTSAEVCMVDITVNNKKGELEIQSLRLRSVVKGKS